MRRRSAAERRTRFCSCVTRICIRRHPVLTVMNSSCRSVTQHCVRVQQPGEESPAAPQNARKKVRKRCIEGE